MGLDSAIYLVFLGIVAAFHAVLPPRGRIVLLIAASCAFYAASNVYYLILLLILCGVNYVAIHGLCRTTDKSCRTQVFSATVIVNVAVLVLFKYETRLLSLVLERMGFASAPTDGPWRLAAPLGLSYFTFQMLSCVTDVYRRVWVPAGSVCHFILFGLFFPQISSGPIPRAERLLPQLSGVEATADDRIAGLRLIAYGLFKKFVVANRLSEYVGNVFDSYLTTSALPTLFGCCFNALQLYADFSGYVDIAIGSARILGIRLDPNFNHPFESKSVTEFWRRWHMTLSFWLRDYIFFPLRIHMRIRGNLGTMIALVATFAICGIWHAATWPFLLLGVAHGSAMSWELLTKSWREKYFQPIPKRWLSLAASCYLLGFIVLGQVLFRSADLAQAGRVYANLFHFTLPGIGEMFAYKGPLFFALDAAVIGIWAALSGYLRKDDRDSTPQFLFVCAILILFLGRLGSAHFIYATY